MSEGSVFDQSRGEAQQAGESVECRSCDQLREDRDAWHRLALKNQEALRDTRQNLAEARERGQDLPPEKWRDECLRGLAVLNGYRRDNDRLKAELEAAKALPPPKSYAALTIQRDEARHELAAALESLRALLRQCDPSDPESPRQSDVMRAAALLARHDGGKA
jgi:hypothetical protein